MQRGHQGVIYGVIRPRITVASVCSKSNQAGVMQGGQEGAGSPGLSAECKTRSTRNEGAKQGTKNTLSLFWFEIAGSDEVVLFTHRVVCDSPPWILTLPNLRQAALLLARVQRHLAPDSAQ
eukprot:1188114-Prorocentrum_minimum.AAC.3